MTSVLAGPVKPMWLSETCTKRSALASAVAAAAVALSLSCATWLITSPPATVRTTAEPNQPACRRSWRRLMPSGSFGSLEPPEPPELSEPPGPLGPSGKGTANSSLIASPSLSRS